jgi:hypothetical protein
MYTSRQNFRRVGHEPIGWRDGIGSRGDIRQRSYTPGGDDDAVRFVGGHSCSRKPSTFHEVFYDFPGAGVVRAGGVGHYFRNGSDALAGGVESLDVGFQRVAAFILHSGVSDVPGDAVSAAWDRSKPGTPGKPSGGDADFHHRTLRNPRGAGGLVALLLQQAVDEGPIS